MTLEDRSRFFRSLNAMGTMFSDEVSTQRQALYWDAFRDRITIEEWEYACREAIAKVAFNKLPLPAVLLGYIHELHAKQRRRAEEQAKQERLAASQLAQAERLALEASPEWQAAQRTQQAEAQAQREAYQAWLKTQPASIRIALNTWNPPNPSRWRPLSDDELAYEQRTDPVQEKEKLRQQLRQLTEEKPHDDPDIFF